METRAVVRRCACPHVLSKLMQRVQAVNKDVAFDKNVAGDYAVAGFPCVAFSRRRGRQLSCPSFATKSFAIRKKLKKGRASRPSLACSKLFSSAEPRSPCPRSGKKLDGASIKTKLATAGARKSSFRKSVATGHAASPGLPAMQWFSSRLITAASKAVAPTLPPRDTADREEIGAHATLVLEIGLEPFENRRRPVGGADAASGGRDNEHRHGPFAVHLGIGGLRLRVPSACRGADGRPLVRQGHWFTVAVADTNPMEGVQPRIDDAQGNHKRERIGADDARPRPLTEYLAVDRQSTAKLKKFMSAKVAPNAK